MQFRSQSDLFRWIWENRPHVSELTGSPLLPFGHNMWHWQFLHILPKGSYPKWKLNPDNILLALPQEHQKQNDFQVFNEKYQDLRRKYYDEFYRIGPL